MIKDVGEQEFMAEVIERSREVPVVVDFWAEWCGPCRQLGPALEAAVAKRDGKIDLAKVDVDANGSLAGAFSVQGIPAVKAFRDGQVVGEFTGAIPPAQIEAFLDGLVPAPADELAETGDEASLREALELDPGHPQAVLGLSRILMARSEDDEALELLRRLDGDFVADGLAARIELAATANGEGSAVARAFAAADAEHYESALEDLQAEFASEADPVRRDLLRRAMVGIFTELGPEHELAREHRRRLAAALH